MWMPQKNFVSFLAKADITKAREDQAILHHHTDQRKKMEVDRPWEIKNGRRMGDEDIPKKGGILETNRKKESPESSGMTSMG